MLPATATTTPTVVAVAERAPATPGLQKNQAPRLINQGDKYPRAGRIGDDAQRLAAAADELTQ